MRSLDRVVLSRWGTPKQWKGRVLKQSNQGRYLVVALGRDGVLKQFSVHRLVLLAFVGPCPPGQQGLHWDDDPLNNCLDNLRWGSPGDNMRDCIRNGNHRKVNVTHCPAGHEYNDENTHIDPKTGHRFCRPCFKARGAAKKTRPHSRDRTHCPQGHPYDEVNTYLVNGRRVCRTCNRDRSREFSRRKKS